jgi:hypothetical protein
MLPDYDIFEKFQDGSTIWRACVLGRFEAERKLQELSEYSNNEFMAMNIHTGIVLPANKGRANAKRA